MLLSSSNRKYQPYPLLSYFSVPVCLRCLLHHILSLIAYTFRDNRDFVFIIFVQFMMSSNSRMRFGLQIVFIYLYITSHYHHCANLSEDIELMKCLSDIFCRVWEWDKAYSLILSIIQYMGLCVCSLPISPVIIERIYTVTTDIGRGLCTYIRKGVEYREVNINSSFEEFLAVEIKLNNYNQKMLMTNVYRQGNCEEGNNDCLNESCW